MLDQELYPADPEADVERHFALTDRCLHVYDTSNGELMCDPDDERSFRAAMNDYLDTGKDRIIDLTSVWGGDVSVLSSSVVNWIVSTTESRLKSRTVQRALERAKQRRDMLTGEDT